LSRKRRRGRKFRLGKVSLNEFMHDALSSSFEGLHYKKAILRIEGKREISTIGMIETN
jgi:hypothetical protein